MADSKDLDEILSRHSISDAQAQEFKRIYRLGHPADKYLAIPRSNLPEILIFEIGKTLPADWRHRVAKNYLKASEQKFLLIVGEEGVSCAPDDILSSAALYMSGITRQQRKDMISMIQDKRTQVNAWEIYRRDEQKYVAMDNAAKPTKTIK